MSSFTLRNLRDVEDSAPKFGLDAVGEARFAREELGAEQSGVAYHRLKPGCRQSFGHRHDEAEEVHVVLSGGGRVRMDEEIVELRPLDALRIAPAVTRAFEAGPDGMELLVFGAHHEGDGALVPDFWPA
ncbi:MAG TPA: hypothetical protein VHX88_19920 [Solirubrobacteraceae bacterium]|jgi:uncharacterized cupin superfamily protein|nr:hypothetical protein [Solirubrobacteraceae bacterium]